MSHFCVQFLTVLLLSTLSLPTLAQSLKPGFNKEEYIEMMHISARTGALDAAYAGQFPEPAHYRMIYRSKPMGLDNLWDLWAGPDGKAVISLRGTTAKPESWLENFYAAMVPAKGELTLATNETFAYQLTDDPRASVHVGWLVGMAFLSREILPKIDSLAKRGTSGFLIVGHSQGGGIAYLLTAHLRRLQQEGKLPAGIQFKTYCSAAPKPGNLYFAYAYESLTQNGWAYNIINAADWVPEVPVTIQTLDDFNRTSPFANARSIIRKQKFPRNLMLRHVYNKLNKPARKAQRNYQKYLGSVTSRMVAKQIKGFKGPTYSQSNHYVRTGTSIVLTPDEAYYRAFPEDPAKVFNHHFHKPYLYLAEKLGTPFYEPGDGAVPGR